MAKGLERQLGRCLDDSDAPEFCHDTFVHDNLKQAYNVLWDSIEANTNQLGNEVWSWVYRDGEFKPTPLGTMPPPPGSGGQTGKFEAILQESWTDRVESNIRQLWSLTFLAVGRNKQFSR